MQTFMQEQNRLFVPLFIQEAPVAEFRSPF